MLDENLPIFFLSESTDGVKHHNSFYLSRGGSDPQPAYSLHRADPSLPNSKNCYAAALFDAYSSDVLYGEVLIRPKWTQPTLSAEEIRRNGGIPPRPDPIMPTDFVVQLYNPDLQITVTRETGMLGSTHYHFSMPQDTFRLPSGSLLDRTQHDPAASQTTPRINFSLKKESKLTKDMTLYVKGKSTDVVHKKKSKEPDIAIALFKSLREVTMLESNLYRVEMEDVKGLEVVTLLIAVVIRDVFHGQMSQAFNINADGGRRRTSEPAQSKQSPGPYSGGDPRYQMSGGAGPATGSVNASDAQPITDPRTQWEIDSETQRLKQQADAEAREARRQADMRRQQQERSDAEETKRIRKLLEEEEKERRRKEKEVDKETERLQKLYGVQQIPVRESLRPQTHSTPISQSPFPNAPPPPQVQPSPSQYATYSSQHPNPLPPPHQSPQSAPYYTQQYPQYNPQQHYPPQSPPYHNQHSTQASSSGSRPQPSGLNALNVGASVGNFFGSGDRRKQKSNWNLRRNSDSGNRLTKKTSSVF